MQLNWRPAKWWHLYTVVWKIAKIQVTVSYYISKYYGKNWWRKSTRTLLFWFLRTAAILNFIRGKWCSMFVIVLNYTAIFTKANYIASERTHLLLYTNNRCTWEKTILRQTKAEVNDLPEILSFAVENAINLRQTRRKGLITWFLFAVQKSARLKVSNNENSRVLTKWRNTHFIQLIQLRLSFRKRKLWTMNAQAMMDYCSFRPLQVVKELPL